MDSVLEKVQGKTRDVFGPLSRVWTYSQEVTSSYHEDEDDSIQIDLDPLLTHIKKPVLILVQALNTMTYHRRFNALSVIMTHTKAKSILKEKADLLGEKSFLKSWEKITRDPDILGITQGFQIPFKRNPSQKF